MSDDDFAQGSMAAASAIIGFLRANGHGAAANDVLAGWEDGRITGETPVTVIDAAPTGRAAEVRDSQVSRSQGFTGDTCDHCGSVRVMQTGHCRTCADCGTTTGCA